MSVSETESESPLSGIRVLDLTQALAGPFGTLVLADLGAEVIKVERPGAGDPTRSTPPHSVGDTSLYFLANNRNKQSIVLDLKTEAGYTVLRELAGVCDVLVHNYPASVAERLGLTRDRLKEMNPRLVVVSASGFGTRNPQITRRGMDLIVQAMAGYISITGNPDGPPVKAGVPITDLATGLYLCIAVLAGLVHRDRVGDGTYAETSLFHAGLSLLNYLGAYSLTRGDLPGRLGTGHAGSVPTQVFVCSDGWIAIDASFNEHFRMLCNALDMPALADDPRYFDREGRRLNREPLLQTLSSAIGRLTVEEMSNRLADVDIPWGPVYDVPQALRFAQELGYPAVTTFDVDGEPVRALATPIWIDGEQRRVTPPPKHGEHGEEILIRLLGYDAAHARAILAEQAGEPEPEPAARKAV